MLFWYATCPSYRAFENKNGSGGFFLFEIYKYFVNSLKKKKIE